MEKQRQQEANVLHNLVILAYYNFASQVSEHLNKHL